MNTSVKQLSSGYEVEVRLVPPASYLDHKFEFDRTHPQPKRPMIAVKSVAGHTEEFPAAMNTPEWADYDNAVKLYEQELYSSYVNFAYNYAVVRWRGNKADSEWQTQPPDDWRPDPLCPDKTSPRRVLFIKYELIATPDDEKAISRPFATAPLTDGEVDAALGKFRPDTASEETSEIPAKRKGRGK